MEHITEHVAGRAYQGLAPTDQDTISDLALRLSAQTGLSFQHSLTTLAAIGAAIVTLDKSVTLGDN